MKPNHFYEIQVTVIYSRAILVAVTSEARVKRVVCKTWTGTLANSAVPDHTPQNAAAERGIWSGSGLYAKITGN